MTQPRELTEQDQQQWVREQYQAAAKFLATKGLITESVADTESRYLVPFMAIWKMNLADKSSVWVITGDVPIDYSPLSVAEEARDVVRHFSLKWQIQAENFLNSKEQEQQDFAQHLINRAEGLYQLFEKDDLWNSKNA